MNIRSVINAIGTARARATAALERVLRDIFGRDYFISYTRLDASEYAACLAKRLGDQHSVYLDQLDTPRARASRRRPPTAEGPTLPLRLQYALQRASVLVLVGSPKAATSTWVREELRLFLPTGRQAIVVEIDNSLEKAPWSEQPWSTLRGGYRQPESRSAFDAADVSAHVLDYIRNSLFLVARPLPVICQRAAEDGTAPR